MGEYSVYDWREKRDIDPSTKRPGSRRETVYQHQPSNIPGMAYIGIKSTFPVNAAIPPHRHGGAAVIGNVVQGRVLNQMVCDAKTSDSFIDRA